MKTQPIYNSTTGRVPRRRRIGEYHGQQLTKELTELEAEMLDLLKEWVASELGISTVLESKTKRLIKILD